MKIDTFNCFCTITPDSGNPAAVIREFTGSDTEKQALAHQLNLPVSVFISTENSTPLLEYYYPHSEMSLCLHGTIAAAYLLLRDSKDNTITCKTKAGKTLTITKLHNDNIEVTMSAQTTLNDTFNKTQIYALLKISDSDIDNRLPFKVTSVGSPKLLIPIKSLEALIRITPDFDAIKAWSIANQINGFYVYSAETIHSTADFHARGLNPKGGHNEDAATGVAAAALALALQRDIIVEQGHTLNKPSELVVHYHSNSHISVGGRVTMTYR